MNTALPQKFPFILDRNLAKANCTEDRVCTSCDKVVLGMYIKLRLQRSTYDINKANSRFWRTTMMTRRNKNDFKKLNIKQLRCFS